MAFEISVDETGCMEALCIIGHIFLPTRLMG